MGNPFVSSVISTAPVGASSPGFGTSLAVSYSANAVFGVGEFLRRYAGADEILADFPALNGPEYLWGVAQFSQSRRPEEVVLAKGALPPTQRYALSLVAATPGATYPLNIVGSGVTSTEVRVVAPASDVAVSAVANASETFTSAAHGMLTGDGPYRLTNSGGALPAGTAVDTNYWIIRLTADTFQLATSYANAIALTPVLLSGDGTGTHTVRRTANDALAAQIVDRLNSVVGKNFTATQVTGAGETDTILITANTAGNWFSVEVPDFALGLLSIAQTHADPGIATDLAAIADAGGDWYVLHQFYNSRAMVMAAAAWVEAQTDPRRTYHAVSSNSVDSATAAGTGGESIGDALETAAYARTATWWNPAPRTFIDGAISGRVLPLNPGAVDLVAKGLAGDGLAVNLTTTQKANLEGRNLNYYIVNSSVGVTIGGKTASGEWWDVVRNDDSVNADIVVSCFNARRANDILPMDDDGIAVLESALRAALARAEAARIYTDVVVVALKASDVAPADRTARRIRLSWSAKRVGAIVFINATGTVS